MASGMECFSLGLMLLVVGLGYREYERGMCLQMIGRAGRPQFDTEGVAIIMTQRQVDLLPKKKNSP